MNRTLIRIINKYNMLPLNVFYISMYVLLVMYSMIEINVVYSEIILVSSLIGVNIISVLYLLIEWKLRYKDIINLSHYGIGKIKEGIYNKYSESYIISEDEIPYIYLLFVAIFTFIQLLFSGYGIIVISFILQVICATITYLFTDDHTLYNNVKIPLSGNIGYENNNIDEIEELDKYIDEKHIDDRGLEWEWRKYSDDNWYYKLILDDDNYISFTMRNSVIVAEQANIYDRNIYYNHYTFEGMDIDEFIKAREESRGVFFEFWRDFADNYISENSSTVLRNSI